ncbi:hypothetical protein CTA2_2024 [Colletotrichum tanaceti]|uniref:Uncharacterized protein n=1 Tax=Colletotrichum tanaceti TaxID=1306861 RepID=A0A4U6XGD2_9PEZI|nr:hypothetical protein CTA2_2024 [Colletotrichum tanaceti]TKW54948.1 hypothetical protein CTA1_5329 [Colletotrichum tanaceti]
MAMTRSSKTACEWGKGRVSWFPCTWGFVKGVKRRETHSLQLDGALAQGLGTGGLLVAAGRLLCLGVDGQVLGPQFQVVFGAGTVHQGDVELWLDAAGLGELLVEPRGGHAGLVEGAVEHAADLVGGDVDRHVLEGLLPLLGHAALLVVGGGGPRGPVLARAAVGDVVLELGLVLVKGGAHGLVEALSWGHLGNKVRVQGVKAGDDLFEVLAAAGSGVEVNDVVEAVIGRGEGNDGLEAGDEALHDAEELLGVGGGVDGLVVVAAREDALLGDAADLVEVGIVVGEVEGDKAGRLVLDLDIGKDLAALVLLGVIAVGEDDGDVAEQVEDGLCEARRAALARDVVVLDVTPAEEVLQGDGDGGLAAADCGDGHEDDVPGDFGADGGVGGHVRELEVGGVGALDILEGEEVVAQGDDAVVLLVELGEVLVGLEAAAGVEEILLSDLDVFLVARRLARDHGLGALSPLAVHEVGLLELVLKEPVAVRGRGRVVALLAADDETLDVAVAVGPRLGNLLEEGLDLVYVVHGDEADLAKAPGIAEGLNQGAGVGDELGEVEVDAVDVQASLVRAVLEDVLFEGVVTELGDGGGVTVAQLPGEVLLGLAQGGQLLLDHALSGDGVADVGVAPLAGRVLAADEQGAVLEA